MWKRFKDFFAPFTVIAQELTTLRQLYELDLASRNPPIIRITESPGKSDTTISYGETDDRKSAALDLDEAWAGDD